MLGLYIHFPFCRAKCPYCDFYSVAADDWAALPAERFFSVLEGELALWVEDEPSLRGRALGSIYFGGGTPSLAPVEAVAALIESARSVFTLSPEAEITLEGNPGVADQERFAGYRRAGVNRLSLGAQSFRQADLEALGRIHSADQSRKALRLAREAGFENLAVDLMFGVPGQSVADFAANLEELIALAPEHVSVYGLTIHQGTPLERHLREGRLHLPGEEAQAEMFLTARTMLRKAGFAHYEISNYARPGLESRHNQLYWNGGDWLGLGPSAHTSLKCRRFENPASISDWVKAIEAGGLATRPEEPPTERAALGEAVMLGLRQSQGVSLEDLAERFGPTAAASVQSLFEELIEVGLARAEGPRRALSEQGLLVADSIMARFF